MEQVQEFLKILIIESNEPDALSLKNSLREYDYLCLSARAQDEAVALCKQHSFYLIIFDIELQLMEHTPYQLLFEKISAVSDAKLLLYISSTKKLKRETLFKYGILDYFVKDQPMQRTAAQIDKLIKRLHENSSASILLIDDSSLIDHSLPQLLLQRNYKIESVSSCTDGLYLLNHKKFDLIILNVEMPKIDGSSLLEYIRNEFENDMVPILILAEHEDPDFINRLYKLGATHLHKNPNLYEALLLNIDYWIDYHRKSRELMNNQRLLKEYKETVDASNIVSKTDTKGFITYVNQQFCEISGYTPDELLGRPHNIVRHADMSSDAFKDMWFTIKNKNIWKGLVKNRAKDGRAYYVETTIKPIVDNSENIMEYIGIRKDVTAHEELKQQLQSKLKLTTNDLQEMLNLSHEYHKAMESSTILTRANTKGVITYINESFTEALGYTSIEIVGQDHRIMKHPDTPKQLIKNLWETILSGKTWKGMVLNLHKSGETVWLDTVIVPIKNIKGEIIEYLTIRHDVSDVIHLNDEIEATQGELIYTMGAAAETRSKETGNHIKRVAHYSKLLARLSGLDAKESEIIFQASPMHDIGKIAIPDHVLKKPGKLTADEWEVMKTHSELGYKILNRSERSILKASATIAYEHHEKWDGSGYPRGLKGNDIHIYGRIAAIADVFDALGSDRVYKKAWKIEAILKLFQEEQGRHFDPNLTTLLFDNLDKFLEIRDTFVDETYQEKEEETAAT